MKSRRMVRLPIILAALSVLLASCHVAPFNPESEAVVSGFSPEILRPNITAEDEVTLPTSTVTITVINSIPLTLTKFFIDYIGPTGEKIESPGLSVGGGLAKFIKPGEGTTEATVELEILTEDVYDYASQRTPSYLVDDITPIVARVTFTGVDENSNRVSFTGSVVIDTTPGSQ